MQYKLINLKTKEETICDKVVIDGFDYYVNETKIFELKPDDKYATIVENHRRIVFYTKHIQSKDIVVIATNNPNIDIPKIVDKVERLADKYFKTTSFGNTNKYNAYKKFKDGYNESQKTHPFSLEDVEFFVKKTLEDAKESVSWSNTYYKHLSEKLLQIWEEQKPKIIYYE